MRFFFYLVFSAEATRTKISKSRNECICERVSLDFQETRFYVAFFYWSFLFRTPWRRLMLLPKIKFWFFFNSSFIFFRDCLKLRFSFYRVRNLSSVDFCRQMHFLEKKKKLQFEGLKKKMDYKNLFIFALEIRNMKGRFYFIFFSSLQVSLFLCRKYGIVREKRNSCDKRW